MGHALKIKKPTEFRKTLFETLEKTCDGESFLIYHKKGRAVLQGEEEYFDLLERMETLKSINRGLQDYVDGKVQSHVAMREHFRAYAQKRKK